jgi:hypothetical protein
MYNLSRQWAKHGHSMDIFILELIGRFDGRPGLRRQKLRVE